MQITLVETELKQALTEYIGRQMKVADGMKMNIQFMATRGDEGFKAVIEITPSALAEQAPFREAQAPKAVVHQEAPIRQQPFVAPSTARSPEPTVEAQAEIEEDKAVVEELPASEDNSTGAQAEHQAVSNAPRSLFKGLNKPKN